MDDQGGQQTSTTHIPGKLFPREKSLLRDNYF